MMTTLKLREPDANIRNWPADDRPSEKLRAKGADALSDAEVLSILLRNGYGEENAVNLEQWLRDEASANFKEVRQAVKARYGVWETSKPGVVAILVIEQKLLAPEDIDPELRRLLPAKREGE